MISTVPPTTLDDNRIIYMHGNFDEDKAKEIITKLLQLEAHDPTKDILMIIDSYGGHVHSLLAIHDIIKYILRCDVATLAIGKTMSCGQMLLMSGTKGKRFVTPNTSVLIHEINSGTFGKLREMENDLTESKRLQSIFSNMIVKYSNISKTKLKEILAKDYYMSANEAITLGVADFVVNKPKELYGKLK